jgi:hypothetical protein
METSELDVAKELPSIYMVMQLSVDSFAEQDPTQEEINALGRELARLWTGQMMTKKAIVSYKSTVLSSLSWANPDGTP